jgi:thioredoxin-like negative regulator of GroEL
MATKVANGQLEPDGLVAAEARDAQQGRPRLVFFYGRTSGLSRRVEAYLAQVLQRHRNHSTFKLIRVPVEDNPDLAKRFKITELPTLVVIEERRLRARLEAPRDRASIEATLSPWLL